MVLSRTLAMIVFHQYISWDMLGLVVGGRVTGGGCGHPTPATVLQLARVWSGTMQ